MEARIRTLLLGGIVTCLLASRAVVAERYVSVPLEPYMVGEHASDITFKPNVLPPAEGAGVTVKGVPFQITLDPNGNWQSVEVGAARWHGPNDDPSCYSGAWAGVSAGQGDLVLDLPHGHYCRAYILGASDGRPGRDPLLTLRAGYFRGWGILADIETEVPTFSAKTADGVLASVEGQVSEQGQAKQGRLFVVPIKFPAGELLGLINFDRKKHNALTDWRIGEDVPLQVQLTQRLHVVLDDSDVALNSARLPMGVPSGVRVFGIAFERSPVALRVTGESTLNVFPAGRPVSFGLVLENVTDQQRQVTLTACWQQKLMPEPASQTFQTELGPRQKATIEHAPECSTFGNYDYVLRLADKEVGEVLVHRTTFARLPPFPEALCEEGLRSRFGIWWWDGPHQTIAGGEGIDVLDWLGVGYVHKFYGTPAEVCQRVRERGIRLYFDDVVTCFCENVMSANHMMHYPRMFLGGPRYEFNEEELARRKALYEEGVELCTRIRKEQPDKKISFGYGCFNFIEEMLHMGFPADLIDAVAFESPGFMRMPERQPELGSVHEAWWHRQMLKRYGYDKELWSATEWTYHPTGMGRLSEQEQADIYMRDLLHGLAYGLKRLTPATLEDVGSDYYFTNWGGSGLFTRFPDVHPKLSYVAFAVAAHELSDAEFVRAVPTGSHSAFCLEFNRRRGDKLFACWTLRGKRPVRLQGRFAGKVEVTDQEGNAMAAQVQKASLSFPITPAPLFVKGVVECAGVELGTAIYADPANVEQRPVASLSSLEGWRLEDTPDKVLDDYCFDVPRQKGTFNVGIVGDPARGQCVQFALKQGGGRPPYIPAYQVIRPENPIELAGRPTALGLWVRGNSGWGRIMMDLRDAKGERWLSIGMPMPAWNMNDDQSTSYIIFDGWRWMRIRLPGHYPAGLCWPRHRDWRNGTADGTGDGIVDYPLTLTGLVLEQRQQIVYVNEMVEASREPVRLSNLTAVYDDPEAVGDWEERAAAVQVPQGAQEGH